MTPESPPSKNNNNTNNQTDSNPQHPHHEHQDNYHDLQEDEDEENEYKNATDNSRVLFVFNLTVDTREEDINKEFSLFGKVESVKIVMDRKKLINRGFCFVTMASVEEANRLKEAKIIVKGQALHIEKAARTEGHNSTPGQGYQGKRTPRERLMPKSLREKDHSRSRGGGRDNSRGSSGRGGGKGGAPPYRQRGGGPPKGRLPPGSYLPPQSGQPPYDYYNYGYYGYPPYGQFPPPPGTPPLSGEEHTRGGTSGTSSASSTSGGKDARPFSSPPYSGYPPGAGYPPYSGYPPGAYYPPGYGYYPPYGPNGSYDYPPYTPPPGAGRDPTSPPPGSSSRPTSNRISPSRNHPRYFSSAGSNYRYNPYPSVSEGGSGGVVPSGPLHPPSPGAGDYESSNYGVYGSENQPWINK